MFITRNTALETRLTFYLLTKFKWPRGFRCLLKSVIIYKNSQRFCFNKASLRIIDYIPIKVDDYIN